MNVFDKYGINSGIGLKSFLEDGGIIIRNATGIEGSQNVIYLPDLTTFNWKATDKIIRINCKEHAMNIIESMSGLIHENNGPGDMPRPYSFVVDRLSDLIDAVYALKTIEGNSIDELGN